MKKKIRLVLDVVVQLVLWGILGVQITQNPEETIQHLAIFAVLITFWQVLHAWYVVSKYHDWQRTQHLFYLKRILAYVVLTLVVGGGVVLLSVGTLWNFWMFIMESLYLIWAIGGTLLAIWYFGISWRILVFYIYKPRSFWDL
ncbi:MAG: hypothetical protein MK212_21065 [Saprospiraceae bacterium]|nr:hypothetical protein [Saprospiraceae bacterium]